MENVNYKINPCGQYYTVLKRDSQKTVFVFVWDFFHFLSFDDTLPDLRYYGTAKTRQDAEELIRRELPDRPIRWKYCPRSCTY